MSGREASCCRDRLGRNEPTAGDDGHEKKSNRRRFRREMRPMHQHTEEGECTRDADGNQSLFLPLLRILIRFFAFACRFKSRIVDRFDQCFRRDLFVMGDDCVARHNVHSHFAYTC